MSLSRFHAEGGLRVISPEDPEAYWNLEIAVHDWVWHTYSDLMYQCANFVAGLPAVVDVPYDGGEVIPVCGSVAADRLGSVVEEWWTRALASLAGP